MDNLYDALRFLHVMSFVFMSVPLFNLIVVNERVALGKEFDFSVDRYMENIIGRGASRCFVFQTSVAITGLLLLVEGPLGLEALWSSWVIMAKTILLIVLTLMLSHIHLRVQPRIESILSGLSADSAIPPEVPSRLKPYRVLRKRIATFCLFLVITIIILGLQVYGEFSLWLNIMLFAVAALFAWRVSKSLIRFGWV